MRSARSLRGRVLRATGKLRVDDREGAEPIRIDELISPLRYDVLARQRMFELLAEMPAADRSAIDRVIELAGETAYFVWFRTVVIPRFRPELIGDDDAIDLAFGVRVKRSVELYESFMASGYRAREWPITLFSGRRILATDSGKRLDRRLYAGDGCHRLALLRSTGTSTLEPGAYRVHEMPRLSPLDQTTRLIPALGIGPEEYFDFLALSYAPDRGCRTREELIERVRSDDPGRLAELERVLELDTPLLADRRGSGD